MNKVKNYIGQFHPIVGLLLIGTVLSRGSAFMTLPFLSIFLSKHMEVSPLMIGLTVGTSPLMGTVGGFVGGSLSDRFGRKPIMLISVFGLAFVYYGFTVANGQVWFILLNAVNGLCGSFFEPSSQAMMADFTEKNQRMKVYSLRYTAINIGASVGPLIGAYLANTSARLSFLITGSTYFLYGIVLLWLMKKLVNSEDHLNKKIVSFSDAFKIVKTDKALRYLVFGIILSNIGYVQMDSTFPQFLAKNLENGVVIFSVILTMNAGMVVCLQMTLSHFAEKFSPMQVMVVGAIFISAGLLGFSIVTGWVPAIISMVLFTMGEVFIFPSNNMMIDALAPEQLRGTYFGAGQFRKIGNFLGPIIGGYLMEHLTGQIMFWIIAIVSLSSILFFLAGNKTYLKLRENAVGKSL